MGGAGLAGALAAHRPGVSVQPAGHIDGQPQRRAGLHQRQPLLHQRAAGPVRLQRRAYAEQGVNADIKILRRFAEHSHARIQCPLARGLGVGRQGAFSGGRAGPGKADFFAPLVQMQRRFKAVAAVVAGAAGNPDMPRVGRERQRQPGHGQTGALHQRVRRQRSGGVLLDVAGGSNAVKRLAKRRGDSLHPGIVSPRTFPVIGFSLNLGGGCPALPCRFRRAAWPSDPPVLSRCRSSAPSRWRRVRS